MTHLQFSEEVSFPREVVTSKLAFQGQSGEGKTFCALKLSELMLEAGDQIIWCDVAVLRGRYVQVRYEITSSGATAGRFVFGDSPGSERHPGLAHWIATSRCPRAAAIRAGASPRPRRR